MTLYHRAVGGLQVLLHRYCQSATSPVGVPVANRNQREIAAADGRLRQHGHPADRPSPAIPRFREWLGRVRQARCYEAFEHEVLPLTFVADALQPQRDPTRFPLSQVMFNYIQPTSSEGPRRQRGLAFGWENVDSDPISTRSDWCSISRTASEVCGAS